MPRIISLLFCLSLFLQAETPLKYQRKFPRTLIFSRAQYHYNPVLNYAGRWADRPLLTDPELNDARPSGTTSIKALQAIGRNTGLYGLDGLASLYGAGTPSLIRQLEQAAIPGFFLLPEIYAAGKGCYDTPAALKEMRKYTDPVFLSSAKSSLSLKYKGKTIISSYHADKQSPEFWKALLADYARTEGDIFLFLPLLERPCGRPWHHWRHEFEQMKYRPSADWAEKIRNHFRAYARATDGLYLACGPVISNADRHTDIRFFKYMIRTASEVMCEPEFKDKLFAIAARIGHENSSRVGYIRGSYGTWCYRETMEAALAANPDIIIIPEWDEQNENTSLRPTVYNLSSFMRLTRGYRNLSPALPGDDKTVPNLIFSARKVVVPGERPEFELVSLPDFSKPYQVRLILQDHARNIRHSFPAVFFSGKKLESRRFSLGTESWAGLPYVRPELKITIDGRTKTFRDGLQYIKINAVSNCDYQYVKQPLRDLLSAPKVSISQDKKTRFRVSMDAGEPIAYAEILDDNMPVYTATRDGHPYWRESDSRKVFCVHIQNMGLFSHHLKGALTVAGASDVLWMKDTTISWPSIHGKEEKTSSINLDYTQKLGASRYFFSVPAAAAETAVLKIQLPGFFQKDLPLKQVLSAGVYGIPGQSIPVMSVSRQNFQILQPVRLKKNRTSFTAEIFPQNPNSVLHLQILTESGKVWRSAPFPMIFPSAEKGNISVYSESTGKTAVLSMPRNMIPVFDYRFSKKAGTALRTDAGRLYWGMAGGYAAQASGRFGAQRDSTAFITVSDLPKNARRTSVDLLENAWGFSEIGQHLALPTGVISKRTAFTLTINLCQTNNQGTQTILDNYAGSPGLLKIWTENGEIITEVMNEALRNFRHRTGLKLPPGKWCLLKLHYALDHLVLELDGQTFRGKCGYPGVYDTVTIVGGGRKGWFRGKINRVSIDYNAPGQKKKTTETIVK